MAATVETSQRRPPRSHPTPTFVEAPIHEDTPNLNAAVGEDEPIVVDELEADVLSSNLEAQHHSNALLWSLTAFLPYDECCSAVNGSGDDLVFVPVRAVLRLWSHFGVTADVGLRLIEQHVEECKYTIAVHSHKSNALTPVSGRWKNLMSTVRSDPVAGEPALDRFGSPSISGSPGSRSRQPITANASRLVPRLRFWVEKEKRLDDYRRRHKNAAKPHTAVTRLNPADILGAVPSSISPESMTTSAVDASAGAGIPTMCLPPSSLLSRLRQKLDDLEVEGTGTQTKSKASAGGVTIHNNDNNINNNARLPTTRQAVASTTPPKTLKSQNDGANSTFSAGDSLYALSDSAFVLAKPPKTALASKLNTQDAIAAKTISLGREASSCEAAFTMVPGLDDIDAPDEAHVVVFRIDSFKNLATRIFRTKTQMELEGGAGSAPLPKIADESGSSITEFVLPNASPTQSHIPTPPPGSLGSQRPRVHPWDTLVGVGNTAGAVLVPSHLDAALPSERLLLHDELACALISRYAGYIETRMEAVRHAVGGMSASRPLTDGSVDWSVGPNDGFYYERFEELISYAKRRLANSEVQHPRNSEFARGASFSAVALRFATDEKTLNLINSFELTLAWKMARLLSRSRDLMMSIPASFSNSHRRAPDIDVMPPLSAVEDPFQLGDATSYNTQQQQQALVDSGSDATAVSPQADAAVDRPTSPMVAPPIRLVSSPSSQVLAPRPPSSVSKRSTKASNHDLATQLASKSAFLTRLVSTNRGFTDIAESPASLRNPSNYLTPLRTSMRAPLHTPLRSPHELIKVPIVPPALIQPAAPMTSEMETTALQAIPMLKGTTASNPLGLSSIDKTFQLALQQALDVLPSYEVALEALCTGGNSVSVDLDGGLCRLAAELIVNSLDVPACMEAITSALEDTTRRLDGLAQSVRLGKPLEPMSDPEYHLAVVEWCLAFIGSAPPASVERTELERGVSIQPAQTFTSWCGPMQDRVVATLITLASLTPKAFAHGQSTRVASIGIKARALLRNATSYWVPLEKVESALRDIAKKYARFSARMSDYWLMASGALNQDAVADIEAWSRDCIEHYLYPVINVAVLAPLRDPKEFDNVATSPNRQSATNLLSIAAAARVRRGLDSASLLTKLVTAACDVLRTVLEDALRRLDRITTIALKQMAGMDDNNYGETYEKLRSLVAQTTSLALLQLPVPWDAERWLGEVHHSEDLDLLSEKATVSLITTVASWFEPDALLPGVSIPVSFAESVLRYTLSILRRGPGLREAAREQVRESLSRLTLLVDIPTPYIPTAEGSAPLTWNPFRALRDASAPADGDPALFLLAVRAWSRLRYSMNRTVHAKALASAVQLQRKEAARLSSQAQIDGRDIDPDEALESCLALMHLCVLLSDLAEWLGEADRTGLGCPTESHEAMELLHHCCRSLVSSHALTVRIAAAASKHWSRRTANDVAQLMALQAGGENYPLSGLTHTLRDPRTKPLPPDITGPVVGWLARLFLLVMADARTGALSPEDNREARAQYAGNTILASWCATHPNPIRDSSILHPSGSETKLGVSLISASRGWLAVICHTNVSTNQAKLAVDWALEHLCSYYETASFVSSEVVARVMSAVASFDATKLSTRYNLKALLCLVARMLSDLDRQGPTRRRLLILDTAYMPSPAPFVVGHWLTLPVPGSQATRLRTYAGKLIVVLNAAVTVVADASSGYQLPTWAAPDALLKDTQVAAGSLAGLACVALRALWSAAEGTSEVHRAVSDAFCQLTRSLLDTPSTAALFAVAAPRDVLHGTSDASLTVVEKWLGFATTPVDTVEEHDLQVFAQEYSRRAGPCAALHRHVFHRLTTLARQGEWPRGSSDLNLSEYVTLISHVAPLHLDSAPRSLTDFHVIAAIGYDHRVLVAETSRTWIVDAVVASYDAPTSERAAWRAAATRNGGYTALVGRLIGQVAAHAACALLDRSGNSAAVRNDSQRLVSAWHALVDADWYWSAAICSIHEFDRSPSAHVDTLAEQSPAAAAQLEDDTRRPLADEGLQIDDFSRGAIGSAFTVLRLMQRVVRALPRPPATKALALVRGCNAVAAFMKVSLAILAAHGGGEGECEAASALLVDVS